MKWGFRQILAESPFFLQVAMILSAVTVPLVFVEELPPVLAAGIYIGPPPPPRAPAPPVVATVAPPVVREFNNGQLIEPPSIPDEIAIIVEEAPPSVFASDIGVPGGVGVPGGQEDGVLGGIIREAMRPPPPTPPEKKPEPEPVPVETIDVRIGGEVQPPALLRSVAPVYPPIARQARVSGAVKIEAVIGVDGRLTSARVTSGHPLLIQAALDAVRQWVYRPTLLNGQPVKVRMQVTVNFRLGQ